MDIILYSVVGFVSFLAGRTSAPKEIINQVELSDDERAEFEYQKNLNQSLLSEVQHYRFLETRLRGELWDTKQKLEKLQQNN